MNLHHKSIPVGLGKAFQGRNKGQGTCQSGSGYELKDLTGNNVEGREENGKEKSGGRHGRNKAKQIGGGIDVVDKEVIP
ncbi:hypothetical protein Tco_0394103 [Tanacetum coccineum]